MCYVVLYSDMTGREWKVYFDTLEEAKKHCSRNIRSDVFATIAKVIAVYNDGKFN